MTIKIDVFEELKNRLEKSKEIVWEEKQLGIKTEKTEDYEGWLDHMDRFLNERALPSEIANYDDIHYKKEWKEKIKKLKEKKKSKE